MTIADHNLTTLYEQLGDLKYDFRNKNLLLLLTREIHGRRVLDIGCGAGHLLSLLHSEKRELLGIEPNTKLITLARKLHPEISITKGRAEDITKLIQKKVDSVFLIDVLEHIKNDRALIQDIYSLLSKKGRLIILVPAHQFLFGKRDKGLGHYRRYNKRQLISLLQKEGFHIKKIRHWNMLGVIPYWFSENILQRPLETNLRNAHQKKGVNNIFRALFDTWFYSVENTLSFGFGLSLLVVAET